MFLLFRAASLLLMVLFFSGAGMVRPPLMGTWAALIGLGFAAVPGFPHPRVGTHQPIGAYAALLLLGTLILILRVAHSDPISQDPARVSWPWAWSLDLVCGQTK